MRVCCDELERYQPDLLDPAAHRRRFASRHRRARPDPDDTVELSVSAVTGEGVDALVGRLAQLVSEARAAQVAPEAFVVHRPAAEGFRIEAVDGDGGGWRVVGRQAERAVALSDLTNPEALAYAQGRLKSLGVDRALARAGAAEGDSCASDRSPSSTSPTTRCSRREDRLQDRHVVDHRRPRRDPRRRGGFVLQGGRGPARRRAPRRRGHFGGDRRRSARPAAARPTPALATRRRLQAVSAVGQSRLMRVYEQRVRRPRRRVRPGAARAARLRRAPAVPACPRDDPAPARARRRPRRQRERRHRRRRDPLRRQRPARRARRPPDRRRRCS